MERDKSLDIAKGIAIILMMYGHLRYTYLNMDAVYCWIYSFHMPFFIYITGLLTTCKADNIWKQAFQKAKKVMLPYIAWNIMGFIINRILQLESRTIRAFFHGLLFGDNLNSNLPTWYLMSFFWISLFAIFVLPQLDTIKRLLAADIVSIALVVMIAQNKELQDYFRWKGAVMLLPFFITGYLLKKVEFRLPWQLIPFFLFAGYKLSRINAIRTWDYVTVGSGMVGIPYLYLLSAACTVPAMIELCRYFAKIPGTDIIGVFGRHSLLILCTHWLLGNILGLYLENGISMFLIVFCIECVMICISEVILRKMQDRKGKTAAKVAE